jgi:hypothetical protein
MWALHGLKPAAVITAFFDYRRRCCAIKANVCPYNGIVPTAIVVETSASPLRIDPMIHFPLVVQ